MKIITALSLAMCFTSLAFGQQKKSVVMVVNQNAIPEDRYEGVDKSPYLFKEFVNATAHNKEKNETDEYVLNFNGETREFEFIYNDVKSEMDANYYDVIEVKSYTPSGYYSDKFATESITFAKGVDPSQPGALNALIYSDESMTIFKKFNAKIFSRLMTSGETVTQFVPKFEYFIAKDGKKSPLKMNKKTILSILDNADVEKFAKKNKLKLDSESDLKQVLAYYSKINLTDKTDTDPVATNVN